MSKWKIQEGKQHLKRSRHKSRQLLCLACSRSLFVVFPSQDSLEIFIPKVGDPTVNDALGVLLDVYIIRGMSMALYDATLLDGQPTPKSNSVASMTRHRPAGAVGCASWCTDGSFLLVLFLDLGLLLLLDFLKVWKPTAEWLYGHAMHTHYLPLKQHQTLFYSHTHTKCIPFAGVWKNQNTTSVFQFFKVEDRTLHNLFEILVAARWPITGSCTFV